MKYKVRIFSVLAGVAIISSMSFRQLPVASAKQTGNTAVALSVSQENDTLIPANLTLFKKNAHASYYADKFTGRRTASGRRFNNAEYTAAHKNLPFGTRVKVTNERNGKSVIVEITDRGPFTKGREIDLTKKAFMEITANKNGGSMLVTIEKIN